MTVDKFFLHKLLLRGNSLKRAAAKGLNIRILHLDRFTLVKKCRQPNFYKWIYRRALVQHVKYDASSFREFKRTLQFLLSVHLTHHLFSHRIFFTGMSGLFFQVKKLLRWWWSVTGVRTIKDLFKVTRPLIFPLAKMPQILVKNVSNFKRNLLRFLLLLVNYRLLELSNLSEIFI